MNKVIPVENIGVEVVPGKINISGYDDLKQAIDAILKKYDGLVIGEDEVKDAKKEAAKLNKLAKALDDKRKEVKKEYEKPLKEFENQIKELVGEIKEVRENIVSQVEKFENERKEEIKKVVKEYIENLYDLNNIEDRFRTLDIDKYVKLTAVTSSGNISKTTALEIENDINKLLLEIKAIKEEELKRQMEIEKIKKEAIEEFVKNNEVEIKENKADGKVIFEIIFEVKADASIDRNKLVDKTKELICSGKLKPVVRIK